MSAGERPDPVSESGLRPPRAGFSDGVEFDGRESNACLRQLAIGRKDERPVESAGLGRAGAGNPPGVSPAPALDGSGQEPPFGDDSESRPDACAINISDALYKRKRIVRLRLRSLGSGTLKPDGHEGGGRCGERCERVRTDARDRLDWLDVGSSLRHPASHCPLTRAVARDCGQGGARCRDPPRLARAGGGDSPTRIGSPARTSPERHSRRNRPWVVDAGSRESRGPPYGCPSSRPPSCPKAALRCRDWPPT